MATYHSTYNTPIRDGLKQMLQEFQAQHHLTLAFHEQINMERAKAKISKWLLFMLRRLFGRRHINLPASQVIEFLLLPEVGSANLHFHGLIRVPSSHLARFEELALNRWKRVAPKGTLHFGLIGPTTEDRDRWSTYITKGSLAAEILHSSMLSTSNSPVGVPRSTLTQTKANLDSNIPPSP